MLWGEGSTFSAYPQCTPHDAPLALRIGDQVHIEPLGMHEQVLRRVRERVRSRRSVPERNGQGTDHVEVVFQPCTKTEVRAVQLGGRDLEDCGDGRVPHHQLVVVQSAFGNAGTTCEGVGATTELLDHGAHTAQSGRTDPRHLDHPSSSGPHSASAWVRARH